MKPYTSHLHDIAEAVVPLSKEARIEYLNHHFWVGYDRANEIIKRLDDLLTAPFSTEHQHNICLLGNNQIGKTAILKKFYKKHPLIATENEEGKIISLHRPVLLIQCPENPEHCPEKQLYIEVLKNNPIFSDYNMDLDKLKIQTLDFLKKDNVNVLLIDDIQHLLKGSPDENEKFLHAIKNLSLELKMYVVLSGTPEVVKVFNFDIDSKFFRQFNIAELTSWNLDKDFRSFLKSYESILPLKCPSNLSDKASATSIYNFSKGNLGRTVELLKKLAEETIEIGESSITLPLIYSVVDPTY